MDLQKLNQTLQTIKGSLANSPNLPDLADAIENLLCDIYEAGIPSTVEETTLLRLLVPFFF